MKFLLICSLVIVSVFGSAFADHITCKKHAERAAKWHAHDQGGKLQTDKEFDCKPIDEDTIKVDFHYCKRNPAPAPRQTEAFINYECNNIIFTTGPSITTPFEYNKEKTKHHDGGCKKDFKSRRCTAYFWGNY